MKNIKRISVLVSGGGTNLQGILDKIDSGYIDNGCVVQIISSKKDAYALTRGEKHGIKGIYIGKDNYPDVNERTEAILKCLREEQTDLVVLAGYMSILQPKLIEAYRNRIINIHPSLIPKHCGPGYFGHHVHEAVLDAGDMKSGATVHFVDEGVDTGTIILQREVPVEPGDTADTLAARVLKVEHEILPMAVKMFCDGELTESESTKGEKNESVN